MPMNTAEAISARAMTKKISFMTVWWKDLVRQRQELPVIQGLSGNEEDE
jgi:hypothetical protein